MNNEIDLLFSEAWLGFFPFIKQYVCYALIVSYIVYTVVKILPICTCLLRELQLCTSSIISYHSIKSSHVYCVEPIFPRSFLKTLHTFSTHAVFLLSPHGANCSITYFNEEAPCTACDTRQKMKNFFSSASGGRRGSSNVFSIVE